MKTWSEQYWSSSPQLGKRQEGRGWKSWAANEGGWGKCEDGFPRLERKSAAAAESGTVLDPERRRGKGELGVMVGGIKNGEHKERKPGKENERGEEVVNWKGKKANGKLAIAPQNWRLCEEKRAM